MYLNVAFLIVLCTTVESASYQGYGEADRSVSTYPSYSSVSPYNRYPYNTPSYAGDVANFPAGTRYPNYSPSYPKNKYDSSTEKSNMFYLSGRSPTQNYGNNYGSLGSAGTYGQGYKTGYSSYEMPFVNNIGDYCRNRSPQMGIWVDNLMGMWYGVELIEHLAGDSRLDYGRTCIVIHISEPVDQPSTETQLYHVQHINARFRQEYRHLRLLWDESGQTIEYSLFFKNDSVGYWQVFDGQNGTLPAQPRYQQFSGTIQVLKAVNDHLVLNFCQDALNGRSAQLYSVLFTREPGRIDRWDLESVHGLLQTKKLSVASRRMVCGNSAAKPIYSIASSIILLLLTYVVGTF